MTKKKKIPFDYTIKNLSIRQPRIYIDEKKYFRFFQCLYYAYPNPKAEKQIY